MFLYRGLTYLLAPVFWVYQRHAVAKGKEDPAMTAERWGKPSQQRPPQGRLVWIHTSTIGDSLAILRVVRELLERDPDLHFLVTTFSSKAGVFLRPKLPSRAYHQLLPFEYRPAIARFLKHWAPDLVVWTESEIWPAMLDMLARQHQPRVIINGKLTAHSFERYRKFPRFMHRLIGGFEWIQAQTEESAAHFAALGVAQERIEVVGAVKESAEKLGFDIAVRTQMLAQIGTRPCWLAASTHSAEFPAIYMAHQKICAKVPDCLLLHVPRHPTRGEKATALAQMARFETAQRSVGASILPETAVYCCDTLGEMGLWHSLAPVCFVGGTLCDFQGHNLFEAVSFQNAVIHGPSVGNFPEAYRRYDAAGAAWPVQDAESLADAVLQLMQPDIRSKQTAAADLLRAQGEAAFQKTRDRLGARIAQIPLR